MLRQALAGLAALLASAAPALAADHAVEATSANTFSPSGLTVNVGDTVTVVNDDAGFHNVKWADRAQPDASGTSWSAPRTMTTAGGFSFLCEFHSGMSATVSVVEPVTYTYVGGDTGAWGAKESWQPQGIPGPNDTAVVNQGRVFVDQDFVVGTLNVTNAGRAGSGLLTIAAGGALSGAQLLGGRTRIAPGATVTGSGISLGQASAPQVPAELDNAGTLNLTGGIDHAGQAGKLLNSGTIASGGSLLIAPPLHNSGTLSIAGGTLDLQGGSALDSAGAITVGTGATMKIAKGVYTAAAGATIGGLGRIVIDGGRLHALTGSTLVLGVLEIKGSVGDLVLDGTATVGTLRVSGDIAGPAKRLGTGTLTVTNDFETLGNSMFTGTGVTVIQPDEAFGEHTIQLDRGHRMRFEQDLVRTGGYLLIGNGVLESPGGDEGTLEVGGLLDIPTDSAYGPTDGTGILRLLSSGSFSVPGDFQMSAVLETHGTTAIAGKLLAFNGMKVAGGTTTLTGTIAEGDVLMSGGRLTGNGAIEGQALRMTGGTLAPAGTLTTDGLQLAGTLEIGLDSSTVFDRVVSPWAQLGGALVVGGGYAPASTDAFRIIQTTQEPSNSFASVSKGFAVTKDATGVLLEPALDAEPTASPDPTPTASPAPTATASPAPTASPSPQPTAVPTPAPTVAPLPAFSALIKLPKCAKARSVRVTLRAPARSVKVMLGRRTLRTTTRSVTLRRLPRGAFTLKLRVTLADGRVVSASKRLRPCRKR